MIPRFSQAELRDHALFRWLNPNFSEIGEGLYRASQPSAVQFRKLGRLGIKTIINLRGKKPCELFKEEQGLAAAHGMTLVPVQFYKDGVFSREAFLEILDLVETSDRPILVHCKSGADRTGLVAALLQHGMLGRDRRAARKQLSVRFLHFRWGKMGVLDRIFDAYADARAASGINLRDWFQTDYVPQGLTRQTSAVKEQKQW